MWIQIGQPHYLFSIAFRFDDSTIHPSNMQCHHRTYSCDEPYGELFHHQTKEFLLWMILPRMEQRGLVKNESVGVVTRNCKQRTMQTRAKTEIMATTETNSSNESNNKSNNVIFTSRQVHFYFYSNKFGADLCSPLSNWCLAQWPILSTSVVRTWGRLLLGQFWSLNKTSNTL